MIGTALQKSLAASGMASIPLVRSGVPAKADPRAVLWNPATPEAPIEDTRALEGCAYAVHLAGANLASHRWTAAYKKKIIDSRVDSSKALLTILSRLKSPPRVLVCASATGIYGDRGNEVLTESSTPGEGFLPRVCTAWEAAPEAASKLAIRVVHLRFGVVLAEEGGALTSLLPVFRAGLGGRLGDGRQWMSWVTLDDVVRAIRFALETKSLRGGFNTVSPNPVTNREFTRVLGKVLHRPAPWIVPGFALKLMFGQMAQDTLLASTRAVPEGLESAGFRFRWPELEPALRDILGD
jgi:uncharacterized protein (TIGR01777 family)